MLQSCCWRSWRVGMTVRMLIVSYSTFNLNSWCVSFVLIIWRFLTIMKILIDLFLFFVTFCIIFVCVNGFWLFPFSAVTLLVGWQEGHPACKKAWCWFVLVTIWLELCTSYSSSYHHSPLPSSLAPIKPANPGSPGKMVVKTARDNSLWLYYFTVLFCEDFSTFRTFFLPFSLHFNGHF